MCTRTAQPPRAKDRTMSYRFSIRVSVMRRPVARLRPRKGFRNAGSEEQSSQPWVLERWPLRACCAAAASLLICCAD